MAKRKTRKSKPAAKAAPRRKAPRPSDADTNMINIIDSLNNHIQFAVGIGLAVMGEAHIHATDSSAISQLIETHIEGLQSIAGSFEKIRSAS
jgi:hypothetical protein